MSTINLGINNCFAVKRWPEPERWTDLVRHTLGLERVQFSFDLLDPYTETARREKVAGRITKALKNNGLVLTGTFTGLAAYSWSLFGHPDADLRAEAAEWWRRAVDLTAALGARKTGGHFGAMSFTAFSTPNAKSEALSRTADEVVKLAKYAKKSGLTGLLWEAMASPLEPPHSVAEAKEILKLVNQHSDIPIELCLDVGHACGYDLTSEEKQLSRWLDELCPLTSVIHLQQSDGKMDHHWPFTSQYNGAGIVDPEAVVRKVRSAARPDEMELCLEVIHAFEARSEEVLGDLIQSVQIWKACISES